MQSNPKSDESGIARDRHFEVGQMQCKDPCPICYGLANLTYRQMSDLTYRRMLNSDRFTNWWDLFEEYTTPKLPEPLPSQEKMFRCLGCGGNGTLLEYISRTLSGEFA